jgi:uncharacterized protein YprB with RNaseH-like and TPR domain
VIRPASGKAGSAQVRLTGVRPFPDESDGAEPVRAGDAADVLGGAWHEVDGHRFVVVERTYRPGHRHGDVSVADGLPPAEGLWPTLDLLARTPCRPGLLFLDLETTGLMGGAGTYAFLVGCGWFEGGTFRVRQFLMSSVTGERGLLRALSDLGRACGTVVSYNGKSFDLPLIDTRFLFHRLPSPFEGMPHVDMLHPARRLWRPLGDERVAETTGYRRQATAETGYGDRDGTAVGLSESARSWARKPRALRTSPGTPPGVPAADTACRLAMLERTLCGFAREGDVPGFEIPERYFTYVRTGDARPLEGVLEHNRLDLLSLALVTSHACQLLDEGPHAARGPREALGLGRIYLAGGRADDARRCFAAAGGLEPGVGPSWTTEGRGGSKRTRTAEARSHAVTVQAEALRAFALLARRARQFDEAATAWQKVLALTGCPDHISREATSALAVHYEHRRRDFGAAKSFALRALQVDRGSAREQATRHRVARLDRKMGVVSEEAGLLF